MNTTRKNQIITEIILEATPKEVWNVLVDLDSYPSWNPFITQSKVEIRLGARLENVMTNKGKPMTFRPVITHVQKERRYEWLGKAFLGGFKGRHYFELEDSGDGYTKLTQGEEFTGFLIPLLFPMMREDTHNGFIAMNKALQKRIKIIQGM